MEYSNTIDDVYNDLLDVENSTYLFFIYYTVLSLHEKPYFLFPNVLKRSSFKKNTLEYDLFCIIRKDEILPRKYYLIL